jgi:hypothetical protein
VLGNKAHHTTADATLDSTVLLAKPLVFLNALTFGYTAVIVLILAGCGLVRHAIHAGCPVPHTASLSLVTFHGLQSCTRGCSRAPLVARWGSALPLCCTGMQAAVRRRGDAMTAQVATATG